MSGQLQHAGDDGPVRCTYCSRDAVGPCASCQKPVCGDCCELTTGGVRTWAVCLGCAKKKSSLAGAWGGLLVWLGGILLVLALATALVGWLHSRLP